jgi:hypothetical protein
MGWAGRISSSTAQAKEGVQAAVAVVGGGRLPAGELVGDEQLDVLFRDRGQS